MQNSFNTIILHLSNTPSIKQKIKTYYQRYYIQIFIFLYSNKTKTNLKKQYFHNKIKNL